MTYPEAEQYKAEHEQRITHISVNGAMQRIKYIIIAPKNPDISFEQRLGILSLAATNVGNEAALKMKDYYHKNLDVFIIYQVKDKLEEVLLSDYLENEGQYW